MDEAKTLIKNSSIWIYNSLGVFFTVRDDQPKNVNEHEFVFQQFVEYLITRKDYFYSFRTKINPLKFYYNFKNGKKP